MVVTLKIRVGDNDVSSYCFHLTDSICTQDLIYSLRISTYVRHKSLIFMAYLTNKLLIIVRAPRVLGDSATDQIDGGAYNTESCGWDGGDVSVPRLFFSCFALHASQDMELFSCSFFSVLLRCFLW